MADQTIWDLTQETALNATDRLILQQTDAATRTTSATLALLGGLEVDERTDDADITATSTGILYVWTTSEITAHRRWKLPTSANVGERCGIYVLNNDTAATNNNLYDKRPEQISKIWVHTGASGDTIDGLDHSANGEPFRVSTDNGFYFTFRCVNNTGNLSWIVDSRWAGTGAMDDPPTGFHPVIPYDNTIDNGDRINALISGEGYSPSAIANMRTEWRLPAGWIYCSTTIRCSKRGLVLSGAGHSDLDYNNNEQSFTNSETVLCWNGTEPLALIDSRGSGMVFENFRLEGQDDYQALAYSTGTVTVTADAGGSIVDLSGGTWPMNSVYRIRIPNDATTVTFTDNGVGSSDTVNATGHPFANDQTLQFSGGTLPTGLSTGTDYWVINKNANDFQVSATKGGAAIDFTGNGSGTITANGIWYEIGRTDSQTGYYTMNFARNQLRLVSTTAASPTGTNYTSEYKNGGCGFVLRNRNGGGTGSGKHSFRNMVFRNFTVGVHFAPGESRFENTDSISIASGVVTKTVGTAFPSSIDGTSNGGNKYYFAGNHAKSTLTVGGNTYYIDSRDGDNQITLEDTSVNVGSTGTYTVTYYNQEANADNTDFQRCTFNGNEYHVYVDNEQSVSLHWRYCQINNMRSLVAFYLTAGGAASWRDMDVIMANGTIWKFGPGISENTGNLVIEHVQCDAQSDNNLWVDAQMTTGAARLTMRDWAINSTGGTWYFKRNGSIGDTIFMERMGGMEANSVTIDGVNTNFTILVATDCKSPASGFINEAASDKFVVREFRSGWPGRFNADHELMKF